MVHIGTSGWAYPSWKPDFYPDKLSAKKFLEYYATRLNSVEVNYTFRQLPSYTTLESWLAAVGDGFTFSFKAPQRITHFARLKGCGELLNAFYDRLTPVERAGKLGIILFQFPPNFKADAMLLDSFLSGAARSGFRFAFEFRHVSWFSEEIYSLLRAHSAAICVAESDDLATPDVITAPFRCYRFRRSDYSEAEVREIAAKLRDYAASAEIFAYFKHEETPAGALNAAEVLAQVNRA